MKFKFEYRHHEDDEKYYSEPGSPTKIIYQLVLDEDGNEVLKPNGIHDVQAEIQSHADSVDINQIIARYQAGDAEALNKAKAFYADVSQMQKMNLQDVMNLNIQGKRIFDEMPSNVRKIFENNYLNFVNHPEKLIEYEKSMNPVKEEKPLEKVTANDDKE